MSLENVKHRVEELKRECDSTWTMSSSYENPKDVQSEAYQQVLDIIEEECPEVLEEEE